MTENVQEDAAGAQLPDEEVAAPVAEVAVSVPVNNKRWYVVHAYSGMEKSVMRALTERVERAGMQGR